MRISDWSSDVCSSDLFWLWAPCNFADHSLFFHSNDDGEGHAWNRRAVIVGDGGAEQHFAAATFAVQWAAGTRRSPRLDGQLGSGRRLRLTPPAPVYAIGRVGSNHPDLGHGLGHGPDPPRWVDIQRQGGTGRGT